MYEMMCYCSIDHSMWLINKYATLDMGGSMKSAFTQTLSNLSYSESILFSASAIMKGKLADYETQYSGKILSAFSFSKNCCNCGHKLDKAQKCIGFYCGHHYHKQCVPPNTNYCIECLSEEENQFWVFLNNSQSHSKLKLDKMIKDQAELK